MLIRLTGKTELVRSGTWDVPETAGVYLIHDLRGTLYVGKSINLRKRFEQHLEKSHNFSLRKAIFNPIGELTFSWIVSSEIDHLEKTLVHYLNPICNEIKYKSS